VEKQRYENLKKSNLSPLPLSLKRGGEVIGR
jgi:hypothetical protein